VRATAESLVYAASVPNSSDPDSRVRFKVQEVIRGEMSEDHLTYEALPWTPTISTILSLPTSSFGPTVEVVTVLHIRIVQVLSFF
jgi:hypothetical protein